ncbi:MAG: ATP-binding cassette domain-containing protein [Clostridia bacterium]|nr:ATP-binding cassette domain-containing protein [Clostridia bacterium]
MEELMLRIDNVSKQYKLGQIGGTTLRDELQRLSAKLRGKEDPTRRIGAKDYNKGETFMALNGVSFDVKKGERVGIIGHNGAGKSTLLKLISRVTAPTSGSIGMNGRVASMLEVGTGFHGELTGRENIYMNGAILGMTKKEIDAKMEDIIEFSECRQFIDTPVKRYSSGMYVKLAFSVAAHLDSEIMIMDEVLAVGDMAFQKKCLDKMSDVSKTEGRTILYVSHNMNTIRQLCDRVVVLDHGKVVYDGEVEEGIARYSKENTDNRVFYNYRTITRSPRSSKKILMEELQIYSHEHNRLFRGEILKFKLRCIANETVRGIGYRLEIHCADDTVIGTCFSDKTFDLNKNFEAMLNLSLNTSNLSPGKYHCTALLFEKDQYGNQDWHDGFSNAISFEILPVEGELIWLHQWWGHIHLDDIQIDSIDIV